MLHEQHGYTTKSHAKSDHFMSSDSSEKEIEY